MFNIPSMTKATRREQTAVVRSTLKKPLKQTISAIIFFQYIVADSREKYIIIFFVF